MNILTFTTVRDDILLINGEFSPKETYMEWFSFLASHTKPVQEVSFEEDFYTYIWVVDDITLKTLQARCPLEGRGVS